MEHIDRMLESEEVSWRDVLNEVLRDMDPWDIDIAELATRYKERVDSMEMMNFRIPGNVVLVCAVLLRMKADILSPKDEGFADVSCAMAFIFSGEYPVSALFEGGDFDPYPIMLRPTRAVARRVSAQELIEAIQDALEEKTRRIEKISLNSAKLALSKNKAGQADTVFVHPEVNLLDLIESTYGAIMDILSKKEVALFSELTRTRDEMVHCFISLLHLSNSQRVVLSQEQAFGEIYIRPA